jgi:uncharacterized protein YkwD
VNLVHPTSGQSKQPDVQQVSETKPPSGVTSRNSSLPVVGCSTSTQETKLNDDEYSVLFELNRVRTNPKPYSEELKAMREYFHGKAFILPGEITLLTNEGVKAVDECIIALESHGPLPPLSLARGLEMAAEVHAVDIGSNGITGHQGSDGSMPSQRFARFGVVSGKSGENIAFGGRTPKEHIQQLLIDDGVMSRGHRFNILSSDFSQVGIGISDHSSYGTCCVQTFAHNFESNDGLELDVHPERIKIDPKPLKQHALAAAKIQRMVKNHLAKNEVARRRNNKRLS